MNIAPVCAPTCILSAIHNLTNASKVGEWGLDMGKRYVPNLSWWCIDLKHLVGSVLVESVALNFKEQHSLSPDTEVGTLKGNLCGF